MARRRAHARKATTIIDQEIDLRETRLEEWGVRLAQKREALGRSQAEMAELIGVHQTSVARVEMGTAAPKNCARALAYAKAYQLSEAEQMEWLEVLFGPRFDMPSAEPFHEIYYRWLACELMRCLAWPPSLSAKATGVKPTSRPQKQARW
jgi:transcriptional regulator with XRE-family HTH domain